MPKNFCLPKEITHKFIQAVKDGEIDPAKVSNMTSEERNKFFSKIVGENDAKHVNSLFESKLLLKNQQRGMINWVKTVAGLKPAQYKTLVDKIQKLDTILDPVSEKAFLKDLASSRLGTDITFKEAQDITNLSQKVQGAKSEMTTTLDDYLSKKETDVQFKKRIEYGKSILEMHDYVETINPVKKNIVLNIANLPRTLMATLDFSAPLRQGWGMMGRKEFYSNFANMFKVAFSPSRFKTLQAEVVSRPTYSLMEKSKLRVSALARKLEQREEEFMSNIINKVPVVGTIMKGSERAYTGFLTKLRADVFDDLVRKASIAGEDVTLDSNVIKDIASVVNTFTGSGNLGKNDRFSTYVPALNAAFFSPRKIAATINMFNPQTYLKGSPTARKAALRQLISSVGIASTVLGLGAMAGAEVELDPRSSDFGKLKVGNTRFDVTGGNGNYAVLLARIITNKSKSSTTGKISKFGEGYKPTTRLSIVGRFTRNKLSPIASLIIDAAAGETGMGEEFRIGEQFKNRVIPLVAQDIYEMMRDDKDAKFAAAILAIFGVGVQNY